MFIESLDEYFTVTSKQRAYKPFKDWLKQQLPEATILWAKGFYEVLKIKMHDTTIITYLHRGPSSRRYYQRVKTPIANKWMADVVNEKIQTYKYLESECVEVLK